jgi:hypothetical protein
MSEPWEAWLAGGELPSDDFYLGALEEADGATTEYALFGDHVRDDRSSSELIAAWQQFVDEDMAECTCRHLRVAVIHRDDGLLRRLGRHRPKPALAAFCYWHSDEDCPARDLTGF